MISLCVNGACLSSKDDRVVLYCSAISLGSDDREATFARDEDMISVVKLSKFIPLMFLEQIFSFDKGGLGQSSVQVTRE